jgi:alkylation response protein AidB-like acyl-CoA dehydrogenase
MDLRLSTEQQAFRLAVRDFIRANLDPATHQAMMDGRVPSRDQLVGWQRALARQGWSTPAWPREYGGPGWGPVDRMIFLDELHQAPAPEPLSFNVAMLGPTLIRYGSDEQKARFLPPTANLDIWWCQGFSEPGAGSDLAALRTTAVRDDHDYIVSGHKIWQGMGHHADWMFTLVRTDPAAAKKQAGISFLLIDMTSPGVTVRPIITIDGRHEVNEVFLDEVRVPLENRVGPENAGWEVTKFLLSAERTNIARIGMTKHILRRAKMHGAAERFARETTAIEAELKILEITQLRILDAQSRTDAADPRSSILKLKGVELRQAASELLLRSAGPAALRDWGEPDGVTDPLATVAPNYFILRAASIYGGASEVQKTIIAKTVLGL